MVRGARKPPAPRGDPLLRSGVQHDAVDEEERGPDPSYEDEYSVFQEATDEEIRQLLRKLSMQERELIGMLYFEKMKNYEIGQVLGINAKAVSERHRRLLVKMRRIVAEEGLFKD